MKNRQIRSIIEILSVLASESNGKHLKSDELHRQVFENAFADEGDMQKVLPTSTFKKYIVTAKDTFEGFIETAQGKDGGYKITEAGKAYIGELSGVILDPFERNAINDAMEIAQKSPTFYYNKDLEKAKKILYTKKNLKDIDFEFYLGKSNHNEKITKIMKDFKQASIKHWFIMIESKYDFFDIPKGVQRFKPLFLVHDTDESFMILINDENTVVIQNALNVISLEILNDKKKKLLSGDFQRFDDQKTYKISTYINTHSLKIKGESILSFDIKDEKINEIIDLWNYELKVQNKTKTSYEILFYEEYKIWEFLLRTQMYMTNIKFKNNKGIDLKEKWNNIVSNIKKI